MRVSLLALAIGSLAGHAAAQSGVQIWGIVDQGVIKMNDGSSIAANPGAGARNRYELRHAWQPRLGFRGVEDLGDGLQAFFDLEHRFGADDGSAATPFWTGRSAVGLRHKNWGELRFGREYNPAFYPAVALDPWAWNTVGQMGLAYTWARYNANDGGPRNNNQIQYKTPTFGGVSALMALALGEGATNRGRAAGVNVVYAQGPVYVGFAYDGANNANSAGIDARMMLIGGAYDFGFVRPRVLFAKSRNFAGLDVTSSMVGATVPLGNGRVLVGYSRANPEGNNNDSAKFGLGYHYDLSKRTMLYTDLGSAKTDGQTRSTGVDFGVRHSF
jgi:predicted porin